jgi:hypothetical protein
VPTEIGPLKINDSNPLRHKPKDGWTKAEGVAEVEKSVEEANSPAKISDTELKGYSTMAAKMSAAMNKTFASFSVDTFSASPPPTDTTWEVSSKDSPEVAQAKKFLSSNNNQISEQHKFTPEELAEPKKTYEELVMSSLEAGESEEVLSAFVKTYTWFVHFKSKSKSPFDPTDPVYRADYFSGEAGHGRCGGRVWKWALYVGSDGKAVRCDLGIGHSGPHGANVAGKWYKWSQSSVGAISPINKCPAHNDVTHGSLVKDEYCGLDFGHTGYHLSRITTENSKWRYEPFTAKKAKLKSSGFSLHPPKIQADSLGLSNTPNTSLTSNSLTSAAYTYPNSVAPKKTTPENTVMHINGPVPILVPGTWENEWSKIGEAESVTLEGNSESVEYNGGMIVQTYQKATKYSVKLNNPSGFKSEQNTTPEVKEEPKPDPKKDFTPSVDAFANKGPDAQVKELLNQAQGIINNADRMPLGAFLFAQKVLAHFKEH